MQAAGKDAAGRGWPADRTFAAAFSGGRLFLRAKDMADANDELKPEPTHKPKDGADFKPTGYYMRVEFAPPLSMRRKTGLQFADKVAAHINLDEVKTLDTEWNYVHRREGTDSKVHFIVQKNNVQAQAVFPTDVKEWFESRFRFFFAEFKSAFKPKFIVSSSVMIHGDLEVDGDSREFLANHAIRNIEPYQFGRPIHGLGVRLFFPPHVVKKKRGKPTPVEWQVDVKIESSLEDPSQLYLEADADWVVPKEWNDSQTESVVSHLEEVSAFLGKTIIPYLCSEPKEDSEDEIEGDGEDEQ
jgi:hypothetical protein